MPANPMKVRFDEGNLEYLERESLRERLPITALINRKVANSRHSIALEEFFGAVDHPPLFRLKSSSTTAEVGRLCTLIRSRMLKGLVLGVKECDLNERTLVGFAEFDDYAVLFDNLTINHARAPRIMEIEDLMKAIGSAELACPVGMIPEPVKPTSQEELASAWAYYKGLSPAPFDLREFLELIAPRQSHDNLLRYQSDDGYCIKIEEKPDYGRSQLIAMRCFNDKQEAEQFYHAAIEKDTGKPDNRYCLILSVYGWPDQIAHVSSPEALPNA